MFLKIKQNLNFNIIFKVVARSFCFIGLIFHTTQLLGIYWQGKTIVNVEIEKRINSTLPALTFCFTYGLSFEKLSNLDKSYEKLYKIYLDHLSDYYKNTSENAQDEMRSIYQSVVNKVLDRINKREFDIKVIFQNYTIDLISKQGHSFITIAIDGFVNDENKEKWQDYIGKPVEGYQVLADPDVLGIPEFYKCFTFFSALQKKWREFTLVDFEMIQFLIEYDLKSIPHHSSNGVFLSLHSPNTFPLNSLKDFKPYDINKDYMISYSEIFTKLMGRGYDTNCYEYDLDYKYANFNMRYDCLAWCYQKHINKDGTSISVAKSLIREDALGLLGKKDINYAYWSKSGPICLEECPKDCSFSYYSIEMEEIKGYHETDQCQLYLHHNKMPDIFITYLPKIILLNLICEFGGLLGIWLGISILVIIEDTKKLVQYFLKRNTFVTDNNFIPSISFSFTNLREVDRIRISRNSRRTH